MIQISVISAYTPANGAVNPLYNYTQYNDKNHYNDNLNVTKPSLKSEKLCKNTSLKLQATCFGYSNKYPKYMFCEEIRIKHGLSYISFYPLVILYKSKFSLMAKCLETNAVVVTRVHCMCVILCTILFHAYERKSVNIR